MRRIIITLLFISLGIIGGMSTSKHFIGRTARPRVKAPTTRYHGYELNQEAIQRVRTMTVLISIEGFGGIGRGTGILIDSTHVLTCAHMVESPTDDMWIYPYPGNIVLKGKPVFLSRSADLAILKLNGEVILPHYAVFQEMHYDGEPLTIIGNTLGSMRWFVSFGIVSGEWDNYILTDGVLYGGNSGGPWLNERGEILALTDWTLLGKKGEETGIHGGVSAKTIHSFLKTWKAPSLLDMIIGGLG